VFMVYYKEGFATKCVGIFLILKDLIPQAASLVAADWTSARYNLGSGVRMCTGR